MGFRLFYLLSNLEELDLSGNAFGQIEPENFQDVKNLKVLKIARCRLLQIHPMLYQQLPKLETLDLRDNYIHSLAPSEFRHLQNLSVLLLDGNTLSSLVEATFYGHKFKVLGLSRNNLSSLSDKAFDNTTIRILDMSHNRLDYVLRDSFKPLGECLEVLNISFNNLGSQAFSSIVYPLTNLRHLQASNLQIKNLLPQTFMSSEYLIHLNMSGNNIEKFDPAVLLPLENLEVFDLSYNMLTVISGIVDALANITFFKRLHIHGNPFDCSTCVLVPLFQTSNETRFFEQITSIDDCLMCQWPPDMVGKCILSLPTNITCPDTRFDRQSLEVTSQVGLIVAVAIIVVTVCIIIIIILVYRRHIAHYYTHEEEQRAWKGIYENPALAPSGRVHYGDEKPTFMASVDKVDENIDDLRRPSTNTR